MQIALLTGYFLFITNLHVQIKPLLSTEPCQPREHHALHLTGHRAVLSCTALPFAATAAGNLNMVCSADVVVCEHMTRIFSRAHPDIKVSMVRLSAGEAYARSEARNPRTDIWWAGTGDPHMQAAEEG